VVLELKDKRKTRLKLVERARKWLTEAGRDPEKDEWFIGFREAMSSCNIE
jgi:hypothetical protein